MSVRLHVGARIKRGMWVGASMGRRELDAILTIFVLLPLAILISVIQWLVANWEIVLPVAVSLSILASVFWVLIRNQIRKTTKTRLHDSLERSVESLGTSGGFATLEAETALKALKTYPEIHNEFPDVEELETKLRLYTKCAKMSRYAELIRKRRGENSPLQEAKAIRNLLTKLRLKRITPTQWDNHCGADGRDLSFQMMNERMRELYPIIAAHQQAVEARAQRAKRKEEIAKTADRVVYKVLGLADGKLAGETLKIVVHLLDKGVQCHRYSEDGAKWLELAFDGEDIGYLRAQGRTIYCSVWDSAKEDWCDPPMKVSSYEQWKANCAKAILKYSQSNPQDN